jgi:predicted aspartyl protease
MGRVTVDVTLTNNGDLVLAEAGFKPPQEVRRLVIPGVVDTGSNYLVLPAGVGDQLGLKQVGEVQVRYADRRRATKPLAGDVRVDLLGRSATFQAILEPDRDTALIGAIVLESLDLLVDCPRLQLVPRDPNQITAEVE